jgi:hypothetical protein
MSSTELSGQEKSAVLLSVRTWGSLYFGYHSLIHALLVLVTPNPNVITNYEVVKAIGWYWI